MTRDVSACTGQARQGEYTCEVHERCQRYMAWLQAKPGAGLLVMPACQQEPCPHFIRRKDDPA